MRALTAMCGAIALTAFLAPGAHADEWNKRTYLTFSGPVQVPGMTLPAGTYTFELANPDTARHVIRVSQKDSGKPLALFMTIPQDRLNPPDDNLIMFAERPAGTPQAIQAWFYPGDRIGEEFVYPKDQAVKIAKANRVGVLATEGGGVTGGTLSEADRMAAMRSASVGRVDESGQMKKEESKASTTTAQSATTTAPNATTTAPRTATAAPTTAAPATTATGGTRTPRAETTTAARNQNRAAGTSGQTADQTSNSRRQLPRTASNLVAFELLSALGLFGGFAVRRVRRYAER